MAASMARMSRTLRVTLSLSIAAPCFGGRPNRVGGGGEGARRFPIRLSVSASGNCVKETSTFNLDRGSGPASKQWRRQRTEMESLNLR